VRAVRFEPDRVELVLSDGSAEAWDPEASRVGADGGVYATVKAAAPGGPYEAKFTRHAQNSLAPALVEPSEPGAASPAVAIAGRLYRIGAKSRGLG